MNKGMIRQGDVLLIPVDMTPPTEAVVKTEVILAEGELTGHAHRVMSPLLITWDIEGQQYIRSVGAPGVQTHEDHDPVPVETLVPDTTYLVVHQAEWDLTGQWRQVVD